MAKYYTGNVVDYWTESSGNSTSNIIYFNTSSDDYETPIRAAAPAKQAPDDPIAWLKGRVEEVCWREHV